MIRVYSYTCGKVTISQQVTEIKKVGLAMHHQKKENTSRSKAINTTAVYIARGEIQWY